MRHLPRAWGVRKVLTDNKVTDRPPGHGRDIIAVGAFGNHEGTYTLSVNYY